MNPELRFKEMENCRYYWSYDFYEFDEHHKGVLGFVFDMSREEAQVELNNYIIKINKAQIQKAVEEGIAKQYKDYSEL